MTTVSYTHLDVYKRQVYDINYYFISNGTDQWQQTVRFDVIRFEQKRERRKLHGSESKT